MAAKPRAGLRTGIPGDRARTPSVVCERPPSCQFTALVLEHV
ncbi:MAG: hypothetical protein ABSG43_23875 [Solirubrobacteraceae bacterium]